MRGDTVSKYKQLLHFEVFDQPSTECSSVQPVNWKTEWWRQVPLKEDDAINSEEITKHT